MANRRFDPTLRWFPQPQVQQMDDPPAGDPPKQDPPKQDPPPPQPQPQPPKGRQRDPDELPDENDPPTTRSFQQLRNAYARAQDRVKDLERENADLKTTAESSTRLQQQLLEQTVVAAAGGKLADPQDAVRMLDLTRFKISPDGKVDSKGIGEAVDKLVTDKPYLRAGSTPGRPQPLPGPGAQPPVPAGAASQGNEGMNTLIRQAAGRA